MTFDVERHASTKVGQPSPAPGHPGIPPRWTTGAKAAVGTAVSTASRVWFTISHGILNEIYFPTIDQANTRDFRFLVADQRSFFSDEETDAEHAIEAIAPQVPAFRIRTRCKADRYEIHKEIITHPERDILLLNVEFQDKSSAHDLRLYAVLHPHIGDSGAHNNAWVGVYKIPMLFAQRDTTAVAMACSSGFETMSCGFAGASDGWTDISSHKRMTWAYTEASDGNVVLAAEIPWAKSKGEFTLTLAFGGHAAEAGQQARAGLLQEFQFVREKYLAEWRKNQRTYIDLGSGENNRLDFYRVSTAVLQIHQSKRFPGAVVASLAFPWGSDRGDADIAGYHVIWPRDMVHAAMAKLACRDVASARGSLFYLQCTQEADGHWPQNMWLDGTPQWTSTQMDGTSFGIILADALRRSNQLAEATPWPMIEKAAGFLVRNGPVTRQDRWEENAGYSPNTMAVEIAALLAAADFAETKNDAQLAEFLRSTADAWNDAIDEFTYASGTDLAQRHGVGGYYIRISPPEVVSTGLQKDTVIRLKNLPAKQAEKPAVEIISPDALGLVRFGLRAADDPRILDTVKVIDATLKTDLSNGPVWHRYTDDGYGEHEDGTPFDHSGKGRGWPLLTGERAHYEIARGQIDDALKLLQTMQAQTSECGLIPEQVWDSDDIPEKQLYNGRPTGSAMPLVWAHAEHIRLLRSLKEKKVWDTPPQPVQRYQVQKKAAPFKIWTSQQQRSRILAGKDLRIDLLAAANVRWSADNWATVEETETVDSRLGIHYAMLNTAGWKAGATVQFTFFWRQAEKWEGRNFVVAIV